jgi:phage tail-like protein
MAVLAQRIDPYPGFRFTVEIDGITRASFQQCSGFDSTISVVEHREGGENTTVRKLPGLTTYSNIVLRWGTTDDFELYEWHRDAVEGNVERKNGSIVLRDLGGTERARWNFFNGWPTRWDGPDLNAETNDVSVEMLEIAHEGLEKA